MEICLDCKDKVIKFYHFKRKVKEVQRRNIKLHQQQVKHREKKSKIVHDILEIVENYTEKCSVSAIRIDEEHNKLIIEASQSESESEDAGNSQTTDLDDSVVIKEEFSLLAGGPLHSNGSYENKHFHVDTFQPGPSAPISAEQFRISTPDANEGESIK